MQLCCTIDSLVQFIWPCIATPICFREVSFSIQKRQFSLVWIMAREKLRVSVKVENLCDSKVANKAINVGRFSGCELLAYWCAFLLGRIGTWVHLKIAFCGDIAFRNILIRLITLFIIGLNIEYYGGSAFIFYRCLIRLDVINLI